jgi:hypothetical protein
MPDEFEQMKSTEDNCSYFYDTKYGKYRKICDIACFEELPLSIKRQIREIRAKAKYALMMPVDKE